MDLKAYRQPDLVRKLLIDIEKYEHPLKIMEVCGTHTMAISQWGLRKLLPKNVKLLSGPGCPVCVTPISAIDLLSNLKGVTIATFGDLIRVPGSNHNTLEEARANGIDIRIIYSPLEALEIAKGKETLFVGIGFETTIPGVAYTMLEAHRLKLKNFSVLSLFKLVPPALAVLLSDQQTEIDGFILPGHVSIILGLQEYEFLVDQYKTGGVISGFEPLDILYAIKSLIDNLEQPKILNQYTRVVTAKGNTTAKAIIDRVFVRCDALWRGFGEIKDSGLKIRKEYASFDAALRYGLKISDVQADDKCRCNDVLKGKIIPPDCPLFAEICNPQNPLGACMVSSEGSCAAYYKYER